MNRFRVLLPVCAVMLLGGACGGNSKSSTSATTATTATGAPATSNGSASSNTAAFTDCLAKHGVELPAGGAGLAAGGAPGSLPPGGGAGGSPPAGFDPTKMQEAQKACQSLAPAGLGTPGGATSGGGGTANAAYTSCLKDHGIVVPTVSAGDTATPSSVDLNDATFQAAQQACRSLLPTGSGSVATTTTVAS